MINVVIWLFGVVVWVVWLVIVSFQQTCLPVSEYGDHPGTEKASRDLVVMWEIDCAIRR